MSYAITYSCAYVGVDAPLVSVETHLSGGSPALTIAGYNKPHTFASPEYKRSTCSTHLPLTQA